MLICLTHCNNQRQSSPHSRLWECVQIYLLCANLSDTLQKSMTILAFQDFGNVCKFICHVIICLTHCKNQRQSSPHFRLWECVQIYLLCDILSDTLQQSKGNPTILVMQKCNLKRCKIYYKLIEAITRCCHPWPNGNLKVLKCEIFDPWIFVSFSL